MKRIVVIDDSEIVLESVKAALAVLDCVVMGTTEPTRQVIQDLRPFDLVLLDVKMPEAFGDDVAVFLREACGVEVPIYLYSSLPEPELVLRSRRSGATGYICKSWGTDRLVERVRELLDPGGRSGTTLKVEGESAHGKAPPATSIGPATADPSTRSIYRRFAQGCQRRQERIGKLLARVDAGSPELDLLDELGRSLHDWIGEARLLGFDRLSSAVKTLNEVLSHWAKGLTPSLQVAQLDKWIETLCCLSEKLALQAPTSEVDHQLQALKTRLEQELGRGEQTAPSSPSPEQKRCRILVLDDSPIVAEVLAVELEARGHRVARAVTLAEFERRLADFVPELIFLDINMPDIKGDDLCRWLRRRAETRKVPIILLSSLKDEELSVLAKTARADGYLSKQNGMDELLRYLDELLSQVVF